MKYKALGDNVIIKVEKINKTFKKNGLIEVPDEIADKETTAQTKGILIDVGPLAFRFDDGTTMGSFDSVKIGDIVHFQRYGAIRLNPKKDEEAEYWIINDKGLLAIEEA